MSTYHNETTSKIFLDLSPTAPQEPQTCHLKNITEIEAYLLDEIEVYEWIAKKIERFNTITGIVDTGLITSILITGGISITASASGVSLPVGIALSRTFSLAAVIT